MRCHTSADLRQRVAWEVMDRRLHAAAGYDPECDMSGLVRRIRVTTTVRGKVRVPNAADVFNLRRRPRTRGVTGRKYSTVSALRHQSTQFERHA